MKMRSKFWVYKLSPLMKRGGRFCPHFEVQQLDMYASEREMYNYMHLHILPTDNELIETALLWFYIHV